MVKTVAIITARGGSKRIPGKNIKEFCGKPIIAYSIQAALDSQLFDAVMVSTDDEKIADVARSLGAEVPFMRSEKTSNDFATTEDALKEVIENYHKQGEEFELAYCVFQGKGCRCYYLSERHVTFDVFVLNRDGTINLNIYYMKYMRKKRCSPVKRSIAFLCINAFLYVQNKHIIQIFVNQ